MLSVLLNFKMTHCVINYIYISDFTEILKFREKGIHVDTSENAEILKETIQGNRLNDKHARTYPNKIFEAVLKGEGHLTRVSISIPRFPCTAIGSYARGVHRSERKCYDNNDLYQGISKY